MKALSVWQPWASLLVAGIQHWETRSWNTDYRGILAIHATKRVPQPFEDLLKARSTPEAETLVKLMRQMGYYSLREMPMGKVIGLVTVKEVIPAEDVIHILVWHAHLGDFSKGRFAWRLANPLKFQHPIQAKGAQGLWEWAMPAQAAYEVSRAVE
jgi:hypothetical protein